MPSFQYQHMLGLHLYKLSKESMNGWMFKYAPESVVRLSSVVYHAAQKCSVEVMTPWHAARFKYTELTLLKALPSDFRYYTTTGKCKSRQVLNEKKCKQFLDCLLTLEQLVALQLELELTGEVLF